MAGNYRSLQTELRRAHPDLAGHQAKNALKRGIAVRLRALRDARGLTQDEVAAAAGMTQSMIARLEALSGSVPSLQSIERYIDACGGHLALLISDKEIDSEDAFRDAFAKARGRIPRDLDLGIEDRQPPRNSSTDA
ncbi:helix-turn-helix domain-containing protein [Sulfitobacter sp. W027]|uniref:helix-turn-helix domain-containing protein n=1 Tax=Sulfitobacter sp. W027 TaxID=2867025 RepID=UPI0021A85F5A|nr:helix-turn-helix domain-containing protein [Sulfitobacter sp. W027]UWR33527.1 helix-turn-helix domain-containing protein [Sulfitobacter sp. W027]